MRWLFLFAALSLPQAVLADWLVDNAKRQTDEFIQSIAVPRSWESDKRRAVELYEWVVPVRTMLWLWREGELPHAQIRRMKAYIEEMSQAGFAAKADGSDEQLLLAMVGLLGKFMHQYTFTREEKDFAVTGDLRVFVQLDGRHLAERIRGKPYTECETLGEPCVERPFWSQ